MADRKAIQDHYCGHDIDINTAVDRFSILEDGAKDNSHDDEDTEVKLGPKKQPNPNDPYCKC